MDEAIAYQVISRNNDRNGNPYRLILIYNARFIVINVIESRSSSPNFIFREGHRLIALPSFHLQPKLYNDLKARYDVIREN